MIGMMMSHDQASDWHCTESIGQCHFDLLANYPQGKAAIDHCPTVAIA